MILCNLKRRSRTIKRRSRALYCVLGSVTLYACAPSDQVFIKKFNTERSSIERLREGLCRVWPREGGTLMLGRSGWFYGSRHYAGGWIYPVIPMGQQKRFSEELEEIGGKDISLENGCNAYITMWEGKQFDLQSATLSRQGFAAFQYGNVRLAASDARVQETPLEGGWKLVIGSYTWIE